MKVGIITCWQPDDNYGTQIQCFALQHYLRLNGHEAFLIRYLRANDIVYNKSIKRIIKIFNPVAVVRKMNGIFLDRKRKKQSTVHNRRAPEFRDKYLNVSCIYNNYDELRNNPPKAELYIVGSDQVWNNNPIQAGQFNTFFLNFGSEQTKRISYAASFGFDKTSLLKDYAKFAIPLLSKFDGISVREESGVSILQEFGYADSIRVSDPTLLLSADYYRKIYQENFIRKPNNKYLLLYNLSSKSNINIKRIKKWADKKNLKLIYVTGHGQVDNIEKFYATIPEWLYLIDNAEYIITNSFHGGIFSSIFHKRFVVFTLSSLYSLTNSRLDTLAQLVDQNRIVTSMEQAENVLEMPINWEIFEDNKTKLVEIGKQFLNKYLERK